MVNNECAPHSALRPSPVGIANRAQVMKTTIVVWTQEIGTKCLAWRADPAGHMEMAVGRGMIVNRHNRTKSKGQPENSALAVNTGAIAVDLIAVDQGTAVRWSESRREVWPDDGEWSALPVFVTDLCWPLFPTCVVDHQWEETTEVATEGS